MKRLILQGLLWLVWCDLLIHWTSFQSFYERIRTTAVRSPRGRDGWTATEIIHAVDLASVFYFKRVLCLQHSAVITMLLRHHGWNAVMVIGAQPLPFRSHAWVEMAGEVVNDKPYMREIYQVLDYC